MGDDALFSGESLASPSAPGGEAAADDPAVWMGNSGPWTVQSARDAVYDFNTSSAGGPAGVLSQINRDEMDDDA